MKKVSPTIRLTLLSVLLVFQMTFGQVMPPPDPPAAKAEENSTETELNEIKDDLNDIKKIIKENGSNQSTKVSDLILIKTKQVTLYSDGNWTAIPGKTIDIDNVIILTKDGYIVDIQVIAGNKIFMNEDAPIALTSERFGKKDALYCNSSKDAQCIYTNEIFQYISYKPYIPDNANFTLNSNDNIHTFYKGVDLNTIFDIRLYTDGLATFGGQPNGLIQTDAFFSQIIHRNNIRNTGIFLLNNFKINLTASKFDSKVGYTDSANFNRTSLYQRSWLNTDIALNVINGWLEKKSLSSWYIDIGAGISLSNLAKSTDTVTITSTYLFIEPGFDFKFGDNFGTLVSSKIMWNYSPQIEFDRQGGERIFFKPSVGLFWNPLGNQANRIFIRGIYNVDTRDKVNSFFQLQFGYSLQLTSLVN